MQDGEYTLDQDEDAPPVFRSTRHSNAPPDTFDPSVPRLGRRESEPHSEEVSYLHDVLATNFPDSRVIWDLHHYFTIDDAEVDFQIDVSFFTGMRIDHTLSSYKASLYNNRLPDVAINILSRSTWRADVGEHVDFCRLLGIPVYVVFSPFHVASKLYKPPFLRVYIKNPDGGTSVKETRDVFLKEGGAVAPAAIIDPGDAAPFAFGLVERAKKHDGNQSLYRLALIDRGTNAMYLSRQEMAEAMAEQERQRADQECRRAEQERRRAEQERQRADAAESRARDLERELERLKQSR